MAGRVGMKSLWKNPSREETIQYTGGDRLFKGPRHLTTRDPRFLETKVAEDGTRLYHPPEIWNKNGPIVRATVMGVRKLPEFDRRGLLPAGDYPMSTDDIRRSFLVDGPLDRPDWDRQWRGQLLTNLEYLARQLWQVGVVDIHIGGSFVADKAHPEDIDGYFVCDRAAYKSRALHQALNLLDPNQPWTWRWEHRRPDEAGRPQLPLWHCYRIDLSPYYGQATGGIINRTGAPTDYPTFYRHSRDDEPKGIIRLLPSVTSD